MVANFTYLFQGGIAETEVPQLAWAVKYANSISTEEQDPCQINDLGSILNCIW